MNIVDKIKNYINYSSQYDAQIEQFVYQKEQITSDVVTNFYRFVENENIFIIEKKFNPYVDIEISTYGTINLTINTNKKGRFINIEFGKSTFTYYLYGVDVELKDRTFYEKQDDIEVLYDFILKHTNN